MLGYSSFSFILLWILWRERSSTSFLVCFGRLETTLRCKAKVKRGEISNTYSRVESNLKLVIIVIMQFLDLLRNSHYSLTNANCNFSIDLPPATGSRSVPSIESQAATDAAFPRQSGLG